MDFSEEFDMSLPYDELTKVFKKHFRKAKKDIDYGIELANFLVESSYDSNDEWTANWYMLKYFDVKDYFHKSKNENDWWWFREHLKY